MRVGVILAIAAAAVCLAPGLAAAGPDGAWLEFAPFCSAAGSARSPWAIEFGEATPAARPSPISLSLDISQTQQGRRPAPIEYSDGYRLRAKIHRVASFATLPLFAANYFVGQSLYDDPGDESMKGAHGALVAGTAILFGANTVTGAWNLWEGRNDPNHRTRRVTHGILMMLADVGFLATAALAPDDDEFEHEHGEVSSSSGGRSTHRAVALTSMGIATVSYLIMLFGGK